MDKLNADGNIIGRIGALIVIGAAVFVLGRVCGGGAFCPFGSSTTCCSFSQASALKPAAVPPKK